MKKIFLSVTAILASAVLGALEYQGADVSYLTKLEEAGVKFYAGEKEAEVLDVMKMAGVNWIRLRLWVDPDESQSYGNLTNTLRQSVRVKQKGFKLLLDIHYSDTWADPSHQKIPERWKDCKTSQELYTRTVEYTAEVLDKFAAAGIVPDMVQTGNEITNGMLWPFGTTTGGDCKVLFKLLEGATSTVKAKCPETKIMLHLDTGGKPELSDWWFSQEKKYGVNYDVIGLSYYPFFQGPDLKVLEKNISSLKKKYKKEVIVAETQYPWTFGWADDVGNMVGEGAALCPGIPASPQGQQEYLKKLCLLVERAGGSGVFYWEPAAVADKNFGSDLENLTWFDFNHNWLGTKF